MARKPTETAIEFLNNYEDARDKAIDIINSYFKQLRMSAALAHRPLDEVVKNCFSFKAVAEFIGDPDEPTDAHSRKICIRNHISMKIKEYIDGKF